MSIYFVDNTPFLKTHLFQSYPKESNLTQNIRLETEQVN